MLTFIAPDKVLSAYGARSSLKIVGGQMSEAALYKRREAKRKSRHSPNLRSGVNALCRLGAE